ncbi:GDP-fucose synthetase [Bdellovibrio sp. qaytius]|nr:GDP-fucose synthetase [Bdellovibrio sp. qaytius]
MKILITGSGGMVGQNLAHHGGLKSHDLLTPKRGELDLKIYDNVVHYLKTHQPEMIIHTAGRVGGIQANVAHPVDFLIENIDINRNVILAAQKSNVKKMINLGSSCMYPRNAQNPLTEDLILKGELEPTNEGYALAKIFSQRLCQYIQKEHPEFKYKTLVPCNLYGEFDKFSPEHSHLIPAVIRKLHLAKENSTSEVDIWGDGTARREFMYVGDLADCIWQAVNKFDSMPDLMNVGLGFDYSVNEYYEAASKVIGYQGKFVHDLTKPVGMKQKLVCTSRASEWGWKASHTLQQGLEKTYKHFLTLTNK